MNSLETWTPIPFSEVNLPPKSAKHYNCTFCENKWCNDCGIYCEYHEGDSGKEHNIGKGYIFVDTRDIDKGLIWAVSCLYCYNKMNTTLRYREKFEKLNNKITQ